MAVGCNQGPTPQKPPAWAPDEMADAAMKQLDKNSDGQLSKEELSDAPGLLYSLTQPDVDSNKDGKLSRDEVAARIQGYIQSAVAYKPFRVELLLGGRPVPDAQVKFVPESFFEGIIPTASCTTGADGRGIVFSEGQTDLVRVGMYRIEVSSANAKLPAKSNLGVEVSPFTDPKLNGGTLRLNLKR
jgi:hypothetical protein